MEETAYDVYKAGIAGRNDAMQQQQHAAEMAAYGDAQQTAQIQNRLARMVGQTGIDDLTKENHWKQGVMNTLTGAPLQPQGGQPAAPQPVNNMMAGPGAPPQQQHMSGATPPGVPTPAGQPAAPPPDAYEPLFKATQPGGDLYKQDPMKALALNDEIKVKRGTEMWSQLKMATETGKIDKEKQAELTATLEPLIRANVPLTQEYESLVAKGATPEQARAATQPKYEQMLKGMSQMPAFAKVAEMAPKQFSPQLAYTMADTFKSMEAGKLATGKEDLKLSELTRSGSVTPTGKIIFTNKKGEQFVDGQVYHGRAIKPKVTPADGSGSGGGAASVGKASHSFATGDVEKANEALTQIWLATGKVPESAFGRGSKPEIQKRRDHFYANLQKVAEDAGTTLPALMAGTADMKASASAMMKQKTLITSLEGNEAQAQKNLTRLEGLYGKLGNGTVPILNSVMNRLKKGLGAPAPGTAEAVAYETMIEYTRVITRQTTGAAPTDSAMKATGELINVLKDNPAMIGQKFAQFRGLMKDSLASQHETYNNLKANYAAGVLAGPAPAAGGSSYSDLLNKHRNP